MATAMLHRAQDEERSREMEILYFGTSVAAIFLCLCAQKEIDQLL